MGTSQIEVPPSQFFGFDRIDRNLSDNQLLINVVNVYRLPMRRL